MRGMCLTFAAVGLCAVASGAGLTSQSYVQRGLVMQFDAIDNVGTGVHDPAATVWQDLKGTAKMGIASGARWIDRALDMGTLGHQIVNVPTYRLDSCSTEVAVNVLEKSATAWTSIFTDTKESEGLYRMYLNPGSLTAYLYIHGEAARPSFSSSEWGTLAISCDTNSCLTYRNTPYECTGGRTGSLGKSAGAVDAGGATWSFQTYGGGSLHGYYRAIRHYTCALTQNELAWNSLVDKLRFFSFTYQGTGTQENWAEIAWTKPYHATTTAPADAADFARLVQVQAAVGATDRIALAGLSLEDGAKLEVAEGGVVTVTQLVVEGEQITRGVYTGSGAYGTCVPWVSGSGQVRVLGLGTTMTEPVAGLGPLNYVQDGLIAQFDALDNEGTGTFNADATVWKDLVRTASVTLSGNAAWQDRALDTGASQQTIAGMPNFYFDSVFSEFAVKILSHEGGYPRLFFHNNAGSNNDGWYNVFHQSATTSQMCFFLGGQATSRPDFYFSEGTLELGSDTKNIRTYSNGTPGKTSGSFKLTHKTANAGDWFLDRGGKLHSQFRAFRHYGRALTEAEIAHNRQIDIQRFESFTFAGDGSAVNWSDIAWTVPNVAAITTTAPSSETNHSATVANAKVQVAATDDVALRGLSLEYGATLDVPAGTVVSVKMLWVNGQAVPRGIYTGSEGTAATGTAATWMSGAGQVRVSADVNRIIPSKYMTSDDGWFTFGLASGGSQSQSAVVGEHPIWDEYVFPADAKLRLVGYILLDTVPDVFVDYDTTQLQYAIVNGARATAADRTFDVPQGASIRYWPGTWKPSETTANKFDFVSPNWTQVEQLAGDVHVAGTFFHDNDKSVNITHGGRLTGTGLLDVNSYGRQVRFTGGFAFNGSVRMRQNGNGFWVDTLVVTSSLKTVDLAACSDAHGMTENYSASFAMFGQNGSAATADHPLNVTRLNGNASSRVDAAGRRWRSGGHVIVWGSNTVHVGALHAGVHAVGSRKEQDCTNGFLNKWNYSSVGIGILDVDNFNTGTIYGSTNVALRIGNVAANTAFDFTYQSNDVNRLTLDITESCAAATALKATDLAMLPARISGFKGAVTLTETEARSYEIPFDFTAGPDGLGSTVGCVGSGTLVAAPETSTVDITFPTEETEIAKGKYPVVTFDDGGNLLRGWTVTLNGERTTHATVGHHAVSLIRNQKGIWLGVDQPGGVIIVR